MVRRWGIDLKPGGCGAPLRGRGAWPRPPPV